VESLFDEVTLEQVFRRELPFSFISYFTQVPYSCVIKVWTVDLSDVTVQQSVV